MCISMQVHQQQTKQPQNSGKNKPIVYISFFYYYFRIIIWNLLLKVEKVSIFYATIILAALYSLRWAQVSGGNAYVNINCSNVCIGGKKEHGLGLWEKPCGFQENRLTGWDQIRALPGMEERVSEMLQPVLRFPPRLSPFFSPAPRSPAPGPRAFPQA